MVVRCASTPSSRNGGRSSTTRRTTPEETGVYGDLLAEACDGRIESLLELDGGRKRRTGTKAAPGGPRKTARAEPEGDEAVAIAASSRGPDGAGDGVVRSRRA